MIRVVNRRHLPLKLPPGHVYIGRAVPRRGLADSVWRNPYVIGRNGTREQCIAAFDIWLRNRPLLLARLPELRGKTLVCWCAPKEGLTATDPLKCHGQVIARLVDALDADAP